ncbi:type 4 pilus major pilin [Burkholderia cepacia]|uniref:type 4 pilus major pilin n=1 Tax=Burkholderia cepacia TaxID=292 RepID=UPI002ABDA429|nr:type 4 pilus major pilin [Burkholderia cepacia]
MKGKQVICRITGMGRLPLRGRKRQRGTTMVEFAFYLLCAVVAVYFAITLGKSLYEKVRAYQMQGELQAFHAGILNATQSDSNFASVTLAELVDNGAFASAGKRASVTTDAVTGIFGGLLTVAPDAVNEAGDAVTITYPSVPNEVCALAIQALTESFQRIAVNGTTVYEVNSPYSGAASGKACQGGANKNSIAFTMSRLG